MSELLQDVRYGVRTLRNGWGVTLVAIASLAVAIGGNTAVFGLIDSLLFQPMSVTAPERLVVLQERKKEAPANLNTLATSLANWADLAERSRTTEGHNGVRYAPVPQSESRRTGPAIRLRLCAGRLGRYPHCAGQAGIRERGASRVVRGLPGRLRTGRSVS